MPPRDRHAVVINVAELERSPRAQNHIRSLASHGWQVDVLTGLEAGSPAGMAEGVTLRPLEQVPGDFSPGVIGTVLKTLAWRRALWKGWKALPGRPSAVLVMTPPAVPVFGFVRKLAGTRVVIDWHNTGFSRMAAKFGARHPLARLYRRAEGRRWTADTKHIAVSHALADHLAAHRAVALHDRNPAWRKFPKRDRAAFLARFGGELPGLEADALWAVCPTGWNDEERPEWLIEALPEMERWLESRREGRKMQIILTGRGPARERLLRSVPDRRGPVNLLAVWLTAAAYDGLLANADRGISVHVSTSGLDLPMKLADFRGAGLSALVHDYGPVLREVFTDPEDGRFFRGRSELAEKLCGLACEEAPDGRGGRSRGPHWEEEWDRVVLPMISA